MKKIKSLFAVITVFVMLFTVASAAGSALKFGAETVKYADGDLTISVLADDAFTYGMGGSFEIRFDDTVWAISDVVFNADVTTDGFYGTEDYTGETNLLSVVISSSANKTFVGGEKICDIVFTKVGGEAVGTNFTFECEFMNNLNATAGTGEYAGSIEVIADSVEIAKTITKGGKEYTSVPNKFFENVAVTGTTTGGTVTATYTGGTKTSYVFPFTFGGTILNGSGSVSFDVAIVGVPSNITVTDIAVSVN